MTAPRVLQSDVLIAGGGIIGLSLALELYNRGAQVTVVERDTAMSHASTAAAGMLAAEDPYNPPELALLAKFSTEIYPELLARLESLSEIHVRDATGTEFSAPQLVHCNGAWFRGQHAVSPRKGQMLRVQLPSPLTEVHRAEHIYIVPRTLGPQAGTALIGATIEDAGFDTTTDPADLANLRAWAAELLPMLASATA